MPYTVAQLLIGLGAPVTAEPDEPIQDALARMFQYDYSQLPVVDRTDRKNHFHLITTDSILAALNNFGMKTTDKGLRVRDAMNPVPRVFRPEDNLWEMLEGMRASNAALIIDEEGNLKHIVTSYDTTLFFRQWSEDLMHARDIEDLVKDYITSAFKRTDGTIDEESRQKAIEELTSSNKELKRKFSKALERYLKRQAENSVTLNTEWAAQAFLEFLKSQPEPVKPGEGDLAQATDTATLLQERFNAALQTYLQQQAKSSLKPVLEGLEDAFLEIYDKKEQIKPFKELTLDTFTELFFRGECWGRCNGVFGLGESAARYMLKSVRDTRNRLAHFHEDEITAPMRKQLRSCADWLNKHRGAAQEEFEKTALAPVAPQQPVVQAAAEAAVAPSVEEVSAPQEE